MLTAGMPALAARKPADSMSPEYMTYLDPNLKIPHNILFPIPPIRLSHFNDCSWDTCQVQHPHPGHASTGCGKLAD
jgi:hypothetical protein